MRLASLPPGVIPRKQVPEEAVKPQAVEPLVSVGMAEMRCCRPSSWPERKPSEEVATLLLGLGGGAAAAVVGRAVM